MNQAKLSMYAWTLYMGTVGWALLFAPPELYVVFGLRRPPAGMWPHLCGMFFLILAYYCYRAGRSGQREFMRWTVVTRTWPILFVSVFAAFDLENPAICLIATIDLAAASWTYLALRQPATKEPPRRSVSRSVSSS